MIQPSLPLILASSSPRRRDILDRMGLVYQVDVSDVDESCSERPAEAVLELSSRKAMAVAKRHPDALVLAADTLVYCDEALGKPHTPERAREMLRKLSGNWHNVYTGLTLINTKTGRIIRNMDRTRVHFVTLTDQEIDSYVATGEPLDKAGAYAIQGRGEMFIDRMEGSFSNVMGLPMAMLRGMLIEMASAMERSGVN